MSNKENIKEAKKEVDRLTEMRDSAQKVCTDSVYKACHSEDSTVRNDAVATYDAMTEKVTEINGQLFRARDWYNVCLSEALYSESKYLNNLTKALIVLTAVLVILTAVDILSKIL